jgi:uncharacterized protein YqeY
MEDTLRNELKAAMRARDKVKTGTLRMILASIKNETIAKGADLQKDDYVTLLTREAKKRREASDLFRKGGRDEMADGEDAELAIIQAYLPKAMDEAEVREIIRDLIRQTGATGMSDLGKIMGPLMGKIRGRFDGKRASAMVREEFA